MGLPLIKEYVGTLTRQKMDKQTRIAYEAYCGAKARSKKYGLPAPTMTVRQFMGWWLENLETKEWVRPTCGRLDHSKGYSFDNIEMQEMAENAREASKRTGYKKRSLFGSKVLAIHPMTKEVVHTFPSENCAAEFFGVSQAYMNSRLAGKFKSDAKPRRAAKKIPCILLRGDQ